MNKPLRVLSLFSGIGGLDLAAEWAGMRVVGQVEIDPYCQAVLAKHWPKVKRVGDVREVWGDAFGSVDVIVGGFPCQPFSVAGKQRGASDDRHLWPQMRRVIQVYRPAWVVGENVPGLIRLGLDTVLADLAADGYEATAVVLPACATGAPHLRERVFIVAHRESGQDRRLQQRGMAPNTGAGSEGLAHANEHSGRWPERADAGDVAGATGPDASREGHTQRYPAECGSQELAHAGGTRPQGQERAKSPVRRNAIRQGIGRTEPRLGRVADGLSHWMDSHRWPAGPGEAQYEWEAPRTVAGRAPNRASRLKALGNAVVPAQAYPIFAAIAAVEESLCQN